VLKFWLWVGFPASFLAADNFDFVVVDLPSILLLLPKAMRLA
jgi:hypothetical protein